MKKAIMIAILAIFTMAPPALAGDASKMMEEHPLGSEKAPVTIIEYASMTCSHCADFNNDVVPALKTELIDTGKARLILRDFPFDKHALKAAMMSRCAAPEKYHELVDAIFKRQPEWVKTENREEALAGIGMQAGMSREAIDACWANTGLETAILEVMQRGKERFKIRSTPSFIFLKDGERLEEYPEFAEILKKYKKPHQHKGPQH